MNTSVYLYQFIVKSSVGSHYLLQFDQTLSLAYQLVCYVKQQSYNDADFIWNTIPSATNDILT